MPSRSMSTWMVAPGSASNESPLDPKVVWVSRLTEPSPYCTKESVAARLTPFTFVIRTPDLAVTVTSNVHEAPVIEVLQVVKRCQCPPASYCTKSPTPSPGAETPAAP